VLAGHLLPLGPKAFRINEMVPAAGMALFFALSGFLITSFLYRRPEPKAFMIRRLARIVPLAWAVSCAILIFTEAVPRAWLATLGFFLNYQHAFINEYNSHLWSLCVEMQFYVTCAALVAFGGRKGLLLLPLMALVVTGLRIERGATLSIHTHYRVDEILAGATLALAVETKLEPVLAVLRRFSPWLGVVLLFASASPFTGPFMYLRPYCSALLVGATLLQPEHRLSAALAHPVLKYLATTSYALYVIHGPLRAGWFAEGDTVVKYLVKRPLTFGLTFALAHFSTRVFEAHFIALGKRWTTKPKVVPAGTPG
jgi:peptidoglycan/LPS O-acetylase OafA/YrhL